MSAPRSIKPEASFFMVAAAMAGPVGQRPAPTEALVCSVLRRGEWFVARSTQMSVNRCSASGPEAAARLLGRLYFFGTAVGITPEQSNRISVETLAAVGEAWAFRVSLRELRSEKP